MLRRPWRGRALAGVLAVALAAGVVGGPASGDEISDARSEAAQIADRIEELQHEAEVLTERYLDAQLERQQLEEQIDEAQARAERSDAALEELRTDLRTVAVEAYVRDGADAGIALGAGDASDLTVRRGYAQAVTRDDDDLLDAYRGQERRADADRRDLDGLLADAQQAEDDIAAAQEGTQERIAELTALQEEVTGRLQELVEAEQRRRAEEQARQAREAERAAEAARAAEEASRPAPAAEEPAAEPEPAAEDPAPAAEPAQPAPTTTAPPASTPTPTPAPAPAPPASGAQGAIAAARSVLGVPYKWAGASPQTGFDCSGLIMWAYAQVGRSLPHSSRALYSMSRRIPTDQLQPGDLVFYNSPISHVGLYIGGGQMIHAPRTGSFVEIQSIYYWSALVGGGRI